MKLLHFLLLLLLANLQTSGQKPKATTKNKILPYTQILKQFPLNKASKIELVYFTARDNPFEDVPLDSIDFSKFKKNITLNLVEIEHLTDILYNEPLRLITASISRAACYEPRNAILFYNNKNNLIGYIEICFACNRIEKSSKEILFDVDSFPDEAMYKLEKFFQKLELPTDEEIHN